MIEPETARRTNQLLSSAICEMVEDEHVGMLRTLQQRDQEPVGADRLQALATHVAALARAMLVLIGQTEEPSR